MQVMVDIPDNFLSGADPARVVLEAYAIAAYRSEALTPYETRTLLGVPTRYEFDGFLKQHHVFDHAYDVEDFEQDVCGLGLLKY